MPWSGDTFTRTNGVFTGSGVWTEDRDAGVKIRSDRHDTHDQDLAAGINATLRKNGANSPSANLPMGGFRHTNVDEAEERNEYAVVSQIQDGDYHFGTDTGAADAYSIGLDPAISAYTNGMLVVFRAANGNTGASTLDVNGVGGEALVSSGGDNLQGGEIETGDLVAAYFNVTDTQWEAVTIPAVASQAQSHAGTDTKRTMTAERTEQAINVQALRTDPPVTAGTGSAYTVTLELEGDALIDNQVYGVLAHADSAANGVTIDVTPEGGAAIGAKSIKLTNGDDPFASALKADGIYWLKYDSGSDQFILLNPENREGRVLLSTASASSSASVEFTSDIDSTFDTYMVEIVGMVAQTAGTELQLRTSSDGGTTWDSGASDYEWVLVDTVPSPAASPQGSFGDDHIRIANTIATSAGDSLNATLWLHDADNSSLKTMIRFLRSNAHNANTLSNGDGTGRRAASEIVNGLQFLMSSDNIVSGEFYLYGIRKAS